MNLACVGMNNSRQTEKEETNSQSSHDVLTRHSCCRLVPEFTITELITIENLMPKGLQHIDIFIHNI